MTYYWYIDGLGTDEQELVVTDDDGAEVGSVQAAGFSWKGAYPDELPGLLPESTAALMALQRGDIERREPDP